MKFLNPLGDVEDIDAEKHQYTAMIRQEDSTYVATCLELDIVSQGESIDEATANLKEAVELFLEAATPQEIARRLAEKTMLPLEVTVG